MANRAYLRCLGGQYIAELSCEYSLADGWLDFFTVDDFYVGNSCPIEGACKPHTSSFLLVETTVGLTRFAERITRAGIALTGDGAYARVYAWLTEHFAERWIFCDTTEIEWMNEATFVTDTRAQLVRRAETARRFEFSPKSLLMEFGWGTGVSAEEQGRRPAT
ncbi:MAG: hypothetical protein Q8Q09_01895 [Deltaproteobacteria bacterium]|nr:hypothetical protein [Deltaproteobacteria bacterium]